MHRDVDAAERMLSHLSDLLRATIDRSCDRFVRLECLFGDDFELRLGEAEPGFAVTIDIPLLSETETVAV